MSNSYKISMLEAFTFPDLDTIKAIFIGLAVILYIVVFHLYHRISLIEILDFREIGVFNSREVAIFICVFIPFCILCSRSGEIRHSLKQILKAFFVKRIIIVYDFAVLNLIVIILILNSINFWKPSLLKDAIIWLVFSASITISNLNQANKQYFINYILDSIKFSTIIEFIIGQHTFNIIIEIFIAVVTFLLGGLLAYSKENKYKDVRKFLNLIAMIIGSIMLFLSIKYIIQKMNNFSTVEKFVEFSVPIILSLWFIPFFYVLYLYMNYESQFIAMGNAIKNNEILSYAKRQALVRFKNDIESLRRWIHTLFLNEPKTKEDIQKSINVIKALNLIEENPPIVDSNEGWSPYKAKDFLKTVGVETNFYKKCFDDEWQACSPYIELNNDLIAEDGKYYLADNISYYVSGDNKVVSKLKLILNINSKNDEESSVNKFNEYVESLYKSALGKTIPIAITQSIAKRRNKNIKLFSNNVSIIKHDFLNKNKGYSLVFAIVHE